MAQSSRHVCLIDVAQKTEVSVTTASSTLAEAPIVKLETGEMVKRVSMALRYQPNRSARDSVLQSPEFPWFGKSQFLGLESQTSSNVRGLFRGMSSSEAVIIDPKESKNTWAELSLVSNYRDVSQKLVSEGLFE